MLRKTQIMALVISVFTVGGSALADVRLALDLQPATAAPGEAVILHVTLHTGGADVAGVQTDIDFGPFVSITAQMTDNLPLCVVNPEINKAATSFAFQPPGCDLSATCTAMRTLVFAIDNVDPVPDGALLFTCTLVVADDAPPGTYSLVTSKRIAAAPSGVRIEEFGAVDGDLVVALPPGVTPKATRTATQTPPPTPTRTLVPTRTPWPTLAPLPTSTPGLGSFCVRGSDCTSGFCVDSVCCETPTCPAGQTCNASGLGQCSPIDGSPDDSAGEGPPHRPHKPGAATINDVAPPASSQSGCAIGSSDAADGSARWTLLGLIILIALRACRSAPSPK